MNEPFIASLGPPPFRFAPSRPVMLSSAFSMPFKALATVMVCGAIAWLGLIWRGSGTGPSIGSSALTWFVAAIVLMVYTWWHIVAGKTSLGPEALHQSWVWDKKMELRELAYAKLIRVRGLDWLIAPRLYVRTLAGKFAVFYAADPAMIKDFERLVKELTDFRRM
jgi:hypothetical protein